MINFKRIIETIKKNSTYLAYKYFPKNVIKFIGSSSVLLPIRNVFLKDSNNKTLICNKKIYYRLNNDLCIDYFLNAPPSILIKAEKRGIENTITRNVFEYCLNKSGIIIDIGANFGTLSLIWSKSLINISVHAYEIHSDIYDVLLMSKEQNNLPNLNVFNKAISDKTKKLDFKFSSKTAVLNKGTNSDNLIIAESIDDIYNQSKTKILAIKIDTDGSDYDCLIGAKNIILTHRPYIVIETNEDIRIFNFLKEMNYELRDMNGNVLNNIYLHTTSNSLCNIFAYPM